MTFIKPTGDSKSPFATSTTFGSNGATAFDQPWVSVTQSTRPVAQLGGSAIAITGWSGSAGSGRIYYENNNYYELSSSSYFSYFQLYSASIDELIAGGNSFKTLVDSLASAPADTANSRTNIIRTGF